MVKYNSAKYQKYKKKQDLLNKKQVTLVLDKYIAETLQSYLKGPNKEIFEHKLKSYFSKKKSLNISENNNISEFSKSIRYINILVIEFQEQIREMNETTKTLEKKVQDLIYKYNYSTKVQNPDFIDSRTLADSFEMKILNQSSNKSRRNKIPEIVLDLAINLHQKLNSWKKVSDELAKQGYLSNNNTPYTASSLSRAVSKYRLVIENQNL